MITAFTALRQSAMNDSFELRKANAAVAIAKDDKLRGYERLNTSMSRAGQSLTYLRDFP